MFSPTSFRGAVEFAPAFNPSCRPGLVLFDFDGTLSLIREGWPQVMSALFLEWLPPLPGETEDERHRLCWDDILRLNGKPTIHQMMQLVELVRERGGTPRETLWYKNEYLRRLEERIHARREAIRSRKKSPEEFLVHNARAMLEGLIQLGLPLYLLSGTDESFVKSEAGLLDLTRYFGGHIYGAPDNDKQFSKKMMIERILRENQVPGERLLCFGDGDVEIQNTKAVGGLAVAVASDEANNGSGRFDEWKRRRLLAAGADIMIPDFRDAPALLDCLFRS